MAQPVRRKDAHKKPEKPKLTAQERKDINAAKNLLRRNGYKIFPEHYKRCTKCGKEFDSENKVKNGFYTNRSVLYADDPYGKSCICKECTLEIYLHYLKITGSMKEAMKATCMRLDFYYDDSVIDAAIAESQSDRSTNSVPMQYLIKNSVTLIQNVNKTFDDVVYATKKTSMDDLQKEIAEKHIEVKQEAEYQEQVEKINKTMGEQEFKNKEDVLRILGYDPFHGFSLIEQKMLYGKLIAYLDEDTQDDDHKVSVIIQKVKNDLQINTYDLVLSGLAKDAEAILSNSKQIKELQSIKSDLAKTTNTLAKDNSIAVKHRGDNKSGANTLGSDMKKYREFGFEEAEQNYYDQLICVNMKKCADISNQSIKDIMHFDDKDIDDMLKMQIDTIYKLQQEVDDLKEKNRILEKEITDFGKDD